MHLDVSSVHPYLAPFAKLEELVYEGTKESIEEAKNSICSILGESYLTYFYALFDHAAKIRRRSFYNLSLFFTSSFRQKPVSKLHYSLFFDYLLQKRIIDATYFDSNDFQETQTAQELEQVFPLHTVEYYIMVNDLPHFLESVEQMKKTKNENPISNSYHIVLDDQKYTTLALSAYFGSDKIFEFLLNDPSMNIEEDLPFYAVKGGNLHIISLCEQKNLDFSNTLPDAIDYYRLNVCKWLIDCYGIQDVRGVAISITSFNTTLMCYFIKHLSGVNEFDDNGVSPLMFASKYGNLEFLKFIIKHNAWINMKDMYKRAAIHIAIQENQFDIVKYLIANGAAINSFDNCNITPLMYAVMGGSVTMTRYLIIKGARLQEVDFTGMTCLHYACDTGNLEIVQLLVQRGADVKKADIYGRLPIHFAARSGSVELLKYLVGLGESLNTKDNEVKSPIFYAVDHDRIDAVRYFLSNSVYPYQTDKSGKDLLFYSKSEEMSQLLTNQPKVVSSVCRI